MSSPWVPSVDVETTEDDADLQAPAATGPTSPQTATPTVDVTDRLAHVNVTGRPAPTAWIVGAHGGAAESTVALLLPGSVATGHRWPVGGPIAPVILTARTHMPGLLAAQRAAIEWASGSAPVALAGLLLVADTPQGRLPRPLRDFTRVVVGGVPRSWSLPWVEDWRLGVVPDPTTAPRAVVAVLDQITTTITK